ncbi:hypothetical protein HanPSC8_Chr11g0486411 [Helianthus annuus]|nr:hypothetical protein HanIR_Chr11g0543311 [Helianthus annuus]KAJ0876259.1 hypothetical protein HanPSC8_Chr11g0486411 [Helianthus annuus]
MGSKKQDITSREVEIMGTKCGANHLVTKMQITAMNCHFSGFFREFKGLRFNLSKIQWCII